MEKFRVVVAMLLTAGLLLVGGGKAQAVIGIPDDVPAATLLYPFFKVDSEPSAINRQDSLIVVTNTGNPPGSGVLSSTTPHTWVHITIWSTKSQHVYDFSVQLTPHDVFSCSLLDLLVNPTGLDRPCGVFQAPIGVIDQLAVGDTNLLAGYVTADVVSGPTSLFPGQAGYPFQSWNLLIGHLYIVNLPAGSATGFNAVSIESEVSSGGFTRYLTEGNPAGRGIGQPALAEDGSEQLGFYLNRCLEEQGAASCGLGVYGNRERIDGFSGDQIQTFTAVPPVTGLLGSGEDSPLSLLIRYFSSDDLNGRTEVWLWKDRNTSGAAANVTLAVYDEDENAHSISFSLPDEVNFTSTAAIITPGAPGGWFRFKFSCGPFGYCGYNPLDSTTWTGTGGALLTPIQAVGYSLQFANDQDITLRWDAAFPAHRQYTDYIGGGPAE
jgi:hypothetical protein